MLRVRIWIEITIAFTLTLDHYIPQILLRINCNNFLILIINCINQLKLFSRSTNKNNECIFILKITYVNFS